LHSIKVVKLQKNVFQALICRLLDLPAVSFYNIS